MEAERFKFKTSFVIFIIQKLQLSLLFSQDLPLPDERKIKIY